MSGSKPTVLQVSQNYHVRGGSDRVFFALSDLLERKGHRVVPLTAADPRNRPTPWSRYFPRAADFERPGPLDLARFVYSRGAARAIRALVRDVQPDIAHLHIYYGKLTAAILGPLKDRDVPVVQTLHEYKLICPVHTLLSNGQICEACHGRHFWRALPRKCNRGSLLRTLLSVTEAYASRMLGAVDKVDHFISVSDFVRDTMIRHGIPGERITTIRNFIDASGIAPTRERGEYVLYFGRLERAKGVLTLLRAMAPLKNVPLVIVGDGEARPEIARTVEAEGLHHVRLRPFTEGDELQRLIRGSICTVLPSEWYENLPMAVLESFAHGRPVVASRIGGIPEVITHGEDGLLLPPGDTEALRDALAWMAAHRDEAAGMGAAGRRKVEEQFDPESHYARLMEVYGRFL